jgi:two-component system, NarL family, response regulator
MSARIRVLCVDDHPLVLEGIASAIGRQPDMELVATATSGEKAIEHFRKFHPDVTLMDLQLSAMSGLEAIRTILAEAPGARIVVLTMYQGNEDIYRALRAGAATYVLKDAKSQELMQIVRQVHAGHRPIPPNVASLLELRESQPLLTEREAEVLQLVAEGLRNKEIATVLQISEATVKVHIKNILAKFTVNDRSAAVNVALRRGIIHIG